jgi:hypothetical protein
MKLFDLITFNLFYLVITVLFLWDGNTSFPIGVGLFLYYVLLPVGHHIRSRWRIFEFLKDKETHLTILQGVVKDYSNSCLYRKAFLWSYIFWLVFGLTLLFILV